MKKWDKWGEPNTFGQYFLREEFAWFPIYINGSLYWLKHYWASRYIDKYGEIHDTANHTKDPRE